jgi:L-threonylcarbamoyladenylate synthase
MMPEFENDVTNCLRVLNSGGLILYPTDTVWGIGCDATNSAAVQKIYTLKRRAETRSMIVLVSEAKEIFRYVASPDVTVFDFLALHTRPTTVVFQNAIRLPPNMIAEDGSVAIRIVAEPFCRQLISRFGKPVVSTSANISGSHHPQTFSAIATEIREGVDYVVEYRREEMVPAEPSQIIKWEEDGRYTVIRS